MTADSPSHSRRSKASAAGATKKAPSLADRHIGSRIRMCRKMRRLSQKALGRAVGLSSQQIKKYELGMNRVGASRLQQIAVVLQIPTSHFFDELQDQVLRAQGTLRWPALISELVATPDGRALVAAFLRIRDPRLRTYVIRLIDGLANALHEIGMDRRD